MSRQVPVRPARYFASIHQLDGDQLAPPRTISCVILEPQPPNKRGEWQGRAVLDPAIAMVFQGVTLQMRVGEAPPVRIVLIDALGNFKGDGPPPGYPVWRTQGRDWP